MYSIIRKNQEDHSLIGAEALDKEKINALSDETRMKILKKLAEDSSYPREVSRQLEIDKQKAYYHFDKLEEAGLIEEIETEKVSGGSASIYSPRSSGYVLDLGEEAEKISWNHSKESSKNFLEKFIEGAELEGVIVVGSPDQHGPDQVQAKDGHLAGEIGMKLGGFCESQNSVVKLDTEIQRDSEFDQSMVLVGGVLTNTVTKKFNEDFPASFEGETFPYREIKTPENTYSEETIGVVAKTSNPEISEKDIIMVAGVRNQGTEAAVRAFKNLEDILEDYRGGDFYRVVRGLDMDGDGEIDDYEVVE